MLRLALGAFLAAIAVFFWGFLFWGSGLSDPYGHVTPEAEAALTGALKANLASDAVYFLPDMKNGTQEAVMARVNAGPVAHIVFHSAGAKPFSVTLALGFLHMLVMTSMLAFFMRLTLPVAPTWSSRVKLVALVGVIAATYAHLGNPIWREYPWRFALLGMVFDFASYAIAGLILARFVTPRSA